MALEEGAYNPQVSELKILDFWLKNQFYKPEYSPRLNKIVSTKEMKEDAREPFCIICPPPNAYGSPHLGNISGLCIPRFNGKICKDEWEKITKNLNNFEFGYASESLYQKF